MVTNVDKFSHQNSELRQSPENLIVMRKINEEKHSDVSVTCTRYTNLLEGKEESM